MIALDEDALICDFAETYGIYDFYQLPVTYAATLACGLRHDSRIMMAVSGLKIDLKTLFLAHIADNTAINVYLKTEDAKKGKNPPKKFVKMLLIPEKDEDKVKGFETKEDFQMEWERINNE